MVWCWSSHVALKKSSKTTCVVLYIGPNHLILFEVKLESSWHQGSLLGIKFRSLMSNKYSKKLKVLASLNPSKTQMSWPNILLFAPFFSSSSFCPNSNSQFKHRQRITLVFSQYSSFIWIKKPALETQF